MIKQAHKTGLVKLHATQYAVLKRVQYHAPCATLVLTPSLLLCLLWGVAVFTEAHKSYSGPTCSHWIDNRLGTVLAT